MPFPEMFPLRSLVCVGEEGKKTLWGYAAGQLCPGTSVCAWCYLRPDNLQGQGWHGEVQGSLLDLLRSWVQMPVSGWVLDDRRHCGHVFLAGGWFVWLLFLGGTKRWRSAAASFLSFGLDTACLNCPLGSYPSAGAGLECSAVGQPLGSLGQSNDCTFGPRMVGVL